jgi:hypothetical protein
MVEGREEEKRRERRGGERRRGEEKRRKARRSIRPHEPPRPIRTNRVCIAPIFAALGIRSNCPLPSTTSFTLNKAFTFAFVFVPSPWK